MFINVYKNRVLQGKIRNVKIIKNAKNNTQSSTLYTWVIHIKYT